MSTTRPRSQARETRERARAQIIEAATELVRERSYAELNVGELMARPGSVGPSSIATATTSATC